MKTDTEKRLIELCEKTIDTLSTAMVDIQTLLRELDEQAVEGAINRFRPHDGEHSRKIKVGGKQ